MLHQFLASNCERLIEQCRMLAAARGPLRLPTEATHHGVPKFFDQLIDSLRGNQDENLTDESAKAAIDRNERRQATMLSATATEHGGELFERGYTIAQEVRLEVDRRENIALQKISQPERTS